MSRAAGIPAHQGGEDVKPDVLAVPNGEASGPPSPAPGERRRLFAADLCAGGPARRTFNMYNSGAKRRRAALQHALNKTLSAKLETDGNLGPKTARAVKAFQRAHGLKADGRAGPETTAALAAATGIKPADLPQPGDLPPPDGYDRHPRHGPPAPYWLTPGPIDEWLAHRRHLT